MKKYARTIALICALIVIAAIIWRLEKLKAHPGSAEVSSRSIALPASPLAALAKIAAADQAKGYKPAIEIANPAGFINTDDKFTLENQIGKKVILVDFWTYSCINCIRTLPYLTAWDQKYRDQGLLIVGIHSPEFQFEKDLANVKAAAEKFNIKYPVVLDNDYGTWQAYGNLYWPHEYLIDIAGYIVHDRIGEGGYDETEKLIQQLLKQRAEALGAPTAIASTTIVAVPAEQLVGVESPETYFGAERNEYLANGKPSATGEQTLVEPKTIKLNQLYLAGKWNFEKEFATPAPGAKIIYHYHSAKVFLVANADQGAIIQVLQDGKPVSTEAGEDVKDGKVTVRTSRLYHIIKNPSGPGEHTLTLIILSPGLRAYTFTFG
jgi:thiol-disulfide isomerase/thioredoxin